VTIVTGIFFKGRQKKGKKIRWITVVSSSERQIQYA
jgi:hypothetical protein